MASTRDIPVTKGAFEAASTVVWDYPFGWVEGGVEVHEGELKPTDNWYLVAPRQPGRLVNHIDQTPDLYLEFAKLAFDTHRKPPNEFRVLVADFAVRRGMLQGEFSRALWRVDTNSRYSGEPDWKWRLALEDFFAAFMAWEMLNDDDRTQLRNAFRWEDGRITFAGRLVCSEEVRPAAYDKLRRRKRAEGAAWCFIADLMHLYLVQSTRIGIVGATMGTTTRPRTELKAIGVIGAVWTQLARAIEASVIPKTCDICGRRFLGRSDALTCSDRCRQVKRRKRA